MKRVLNKINSSPQTATSPRSFSMKSALILSLVFILPAVSVALNFERVHSRADNIEWGPCKGVDDEDVTCGFYDVPLDYGDLTIGSARLALAKYRAQTSTKLGTLFVNHGDLEEYALDFLTSYMALNLSEISGGAYDIVSWDRRGSGSSTPGPITCFESEDEYAEFWNNTLVQPQFQVRGGFTYQPDLDYFYSHVDNYEQLLQAFGDRCLNSTSGRYLPYLGTAATVRDLLALSDVIDGPNSAINYWGLSDGTTIGNYLVNMFPERVGRVILDGVQDPLTYANQPSHLSWGKAVASADSTYEGFVTGCAMAGKYGCAIAGDNPKAAGLLQWTSDLLATSYDYSKSTGNEDFSSTELRSKIYQAMSKPTAWSDFSNETLLPYWQSLVQASGVQLPLAKRATTSRKSLSRRDIHALDYTTQAVVCGDGVDQSDVTTKSVFDEFVRVSTDVSMFFGAIFPQPVHMCHRWPTRAIERFFGPWNAILASPILIIGNKNDPETPFEDALAVANLFGNSAVLVEQDGFGHASIAEHSACSQNIIKAYLLNGTLPTGDDTICPTDSSTDLFPMRGPTANLISSAFHSFDGEGHEEHSEKEEDPEIKSLVDEKKTLLIAALGLAGVCAVLLVCLLLVFCNLRKEKASYAAVPSGAAGGAAFKITKPKRVGYADPYDVQISPYASDVFERR